MAGSYIAFDRAVIARKDLSGAFDSRLNGRRIPLFRHQRSDLARPNIDLCPRASSRMRRTFLRHCEINSVSDSTLSWLPNLCCSSTRSNRLSKTRPHASGDNIRAVIYFKSVLTGILAAVVAVFVWIVVTVIIGFIPLVGGINEGSGGVGFVIMSNDVALAAIFGFVMGFFWRLRRLRRASGT
jgi:hypothetical protein